MKKILVLGGYGNVGQVVVKELLDSGVSVGIGGRDEKKIDSLMSKLENKNAKKEVIDLQEIEKLKGIFSHYDVVVNCLEYTFNQIVLDLCIETKKDYIDLGDDYNGIKISREKDGLAKEAGIIACLGAGSAPGIVNVLVKHLAKGVEHIDTITISFADEIQNASDTMLPFNFPTVVEEILGDALLFENGKYRFVPGSSRKIDANFCDAFKTDACSLPGSFVTNHDEQFSLPEYLNEKGIKNVYFVMRHSDKIINLVQTLNEFGFLSKEKIKINGISISPSDFSNKIMTQFAPQNFKTDDKEMLYIKMDDIVCAIVNYSKDHIPAGVMNTGIGAALIALYLVNNPHTPGVCHPEDFVDDIWFIDELKKRDFEIYINNQKI